MEKIRAAVVGYGNIGRYVVETLRVSPDFEIAGIIRRNGSENCPDEIKDLKVVKDVKELGKVDVAILCTPTRKVEEHAIPLLEMGINTVDSFDIHTNIVELRRSLDAVAQKKSGCSSEETRCGIRHLCRMGPGQRLGSQGFARSHSSERNHLHELRTGHEHGAYSSGQGHRRSESGPVHDHPYRYRSPQKNGIHRSEGRI